MRIHHKRLIISTRAKSFFNITHDVDNLCTKSTLNQGICQLFVRHTSCSLTISENCDPDVLDDLESFMSSLIPEARAYKHCAEGADDMPAHIRSVLTQTQLSIPIIDGHLALGRWQALYLWEHRAKPHEREIIVSLTGE